MRLKARRAFLDLFVLSLLFVLGHRETILLYLNDLAGPAHTPALQQLSTYSLPLPPTSH